MHVLAIDQGTTSTKALGLRDDGRVVAASPPLPVKPSFPRPGWVEFDPDAMLRSVVESATSAVAEAGLKWNDIAAIGLANQGETVIAFDGESGRPIYPAISWQDRRGDVYAERWRAAGLEDAVRAATGLRLDSYFSAPKLAWILEHVPEARALHRAGKLRCGTSDAWLVRQLTGGRSYHSDAATASRSMLLDLAGMQWNGQLAASFDIAPTVLPRVVANAGQLGLTDPELFGGVEIPITGLCVDQQAALFGHRAFTRGAAKITYGTGCFVLTNLGDRVATRVDGLLTSVGWQLGDDAVYVLEGGAFSGASLLDWMCELNIASNVVELGRLAEAAGEGPSTVQLIPAFSGLGAPYWSDRARACWLGMDSSADRATLARSAFESIAFSVAQIVESMGDAVAADACIRVDGGLSRSQYLMQLQADVLGKPIETCDMADCTALGVGYLAGLGCGLWSSTDDLPASRETTTIYEPHTSRHDELRSAFARWKRGCQAVIDLGRAGLFNCPES
jgi:glycerol kinase